MSSGNTKRKLNIRGQKHFCSEFAINHICQSITGVIESVAEVVSACHILLMRRLIVPLLDLARSISNNEQLPANQYLDSEASCLAPWELICTRRSIFWSVGGKSDDSAKFKAAFLWESKLRSTFVRSQPDGFGINTTFCLFIPLHCTRLLLCLSGVLFSCVSLLPMPLSSTVF